MSRDPKINGDGMSDAEDFEGTQPVAERHQFDVHALEEWLSQNVDDFTGPLRVEQFKGGQSNPTFKLLMKHRTYVMRAKPGPRAKLLPSAHAIEREYRVMEALSGSDVPVPKMYGLCSDESVIGRDFYVMEHVGGRVLWDQSLPGLSKRERAAIYNEMNLVLSALHSVDYRAVGLESYGKPGNYFSRQIERWTKQYRLSATEVIPAMEALMDWLPQNIPEQDSGLTSIVHGDYRLDNLMFHPSQPKVVALLDWELSTLGHPMADFGYHCMSWHIESGRYSGIAGLDYASLGIPDERSYRKLYEQRTGREIQGDWNFYLAFSMFRSAGILQGVLKRAVEGTASSAQALDAGRRARPMAELGWKYARKVRT